MDINVKLLDDGSGMGETVCKNRAGHHKSSTNLFFKMKLKREQERFSSNWTSISTTPVNAPMNSRKLRGTYPEIGIEPQRRR